MSTVGKLVVCALAYLLYLLVKYPNRAIGTRKRKSPTTIDLPGWPLIGHLPWIIINRGHNLEDGTVAGLKFGPGFSFTLPGIRIIDISKSEWIEYVQKTNFNNFVKAPLRQPIMRDVLGSGIFVMDGAIWKRVRHATSSIFTPNTFKNVIVPSTNQSMMGLAKLLTSAAEEKCAIDMCDLFLRFTLDAFLRMTFGRDLDIFNAGYGDQSNASCPPELFKNSAAGFAKAFDIAQDQMDFRLAIVMGWELMEKLNIRSMGQRMKDSCRVLDDFVYSLVDERLENAYDSSPSDLLSLFITARDNCDGGLGRTELRDTAINLIIAGRDTTAQAISWAFFHLLMKKDLVSKIREQTTAVLGADRVNQQQVTYDNYKRFVWARAVLLEALRLHPSVPKNGLIALADDQIPGGPFIEAGSMVRWSDWQMGRDPSIWGTDCAEFKAERWIDEAGSIKQLGQFKFHSFNGGPRICLGMNLAIFEGVKVIVEVLRDFELEFAEGWLKNVPKSQPIDGQTSEYETPMYKNSITLPMATPMMLSVKLRPHCESED
ncbi:hypothetical protein PCASD_11889 [Puccinia coronata f. sp. avenae]|uniref:Cytochrome P450 n=1 Tax=Puccinia coronata f. sp. avenae TaxID=200324 RepID=A0A2N5TD06_9BASI|nr:hypothetical protein PCASD_11889 [Puccinia coronata f. sp. avenae]